MVEIARLETGRARRGTSSTRSASCCSASSSCTSSTRCSAIAASSRHHLSRDHRDADARDHRGRLPAEQGRASKVVPEIMIPLVGQVKELRDQKAIVDRVAAETMKAQGVKIKYLVGTMIEVPRGAVTADQIAEEAQFFSFGTNDLTQLTFGFSRDDVGKFLRHLPGQEDPRQGSVRLDRHRRRRRAGARSACRTGRQGAARPQDRHLRRARRRPGVDPLLPEGRPRLRERSPYRVPVARLAAAQAPLEKPVSD